jgi:hypothetical protein
MIWSGVTGRALLLVTEATEGSHPVPSSRSTRCHLNP